MPIILNIETSDKVCGVAVSHDGMIEFEREDSEGMRHAEKLGVFVEEALDYLKRKEFKLDAIAVDKGPGSYTGLRIGYSMAKGLCYAMDLPLIAISSLKIMSTAAMFNNFYRTGEELIVPMVDARRQEVYTGIYDFSLTPLLEEGPQILTENFCNEFKDKKLILIGNGTSKFKKITNLKNAEWIENFSIRARDMMPLAELNFKNKNFSDLAYSEPNYLKEYYFQTAKNNLNG